jgi:phosphate/sulfate permease
MDLGLVLAISLAVAFATTNGLHDASNAIATLVATRAATPLQAVLLASVFNPQRAATGRGESGLNGPPRARGRGLT